MKKFLIAAFAVCLAVVGLTAPAYADNKYNAICDDSNLDSEVKKNVCDETINDERSLFNVVQFLINVALSVLGIVAVIVLIIAGQRYVTAQGDPGKLQMAKNMILWGIVGLVVALLATAIVNFIVTEVPGDTAGNLNDKGDSSSTSTGGDEDGEDGDDSSDAGDSGDSSDSSGASDANNASVDSDSGGSSD